MDHFRKPLIEQVKNELVVVGLSQELVEKVLVGLNTLEMIKFSIKELTLIANLPKHLQVILLSLGTRECLREYGTYTSQSINLKELERVATGRMIPPLGWPLKLSPKLLHAQAMLAYDQPLTIPENALTSGVAEEWQARIYAKVLGMIGLRAGTFPPVLPARVVFTPLSLTTVCGSKTSRISEDQVPEQVQFAIGVDTAAMILLAGENRDRVTWEWLAGLIQQQQQAEEEKEVIVNARFSGFVFGSCLTGLKLPLPFVYNLLIRSESVFVKSGILASLAFSKEGRIDEELVRLLRLNTPFHEDDVKRTGEGSVSMNEQTAALFALSMLKRKSGDRQLLKELMTLLDGPLCLVAAMGIGLVANDLSELCDDQVERVMRGANGAGVHNVYSQIASILVLLLLGNNETVEVILEDDRDVGHVRFLKHLAKIWLLNKPQSILRYEQDQSDPWVLSAHILHLAFIPESENVDEVVKFLKELKIPCRREALGEYSERIEMQGWEFMEEIRALTLSILLAGTGDLDTLRIIRTKYSSPLGGDYGRNASYALALGILVLGTQRFTLHRELDRKLLLLTILPWWQKDVQGRDGFSLSYPPYFRFLWLQMLQPRSDNDDGLDLDNLWENLGSRELLLLNKFSEYCAFGGFDCKHFDSLELAIKLAQSKKPSLQIL